MPFLSFFAPFSPPIVKGRDTNERRINMTRVLLGIGIISFQIPWLAWLIANIAEDAYYYDMSELLTLGVLSAIMIVVTTIGVMLVKAGVKARKLNKQLKYLR